MQATVKSSKEAKAPIAVGDIAAHKNGQMYKVLGIADKENVYAKRWDGKIVVGKQVRVQIVQLRRYVPAAEAGKAETNTLKEAVKAGRVHFPEVKIVVGADTKPHDEKAVKEARQGNGKVKVKEAALAPIFRVISLPDDTWQGLKKLADKNNTSTRVEIGIALREELDPLVGALNSLGFTKKENDHKVRASLDAWILGELGKASDKTGVAAVELLRLVLAKVVG